VYDPKKVEFGSVRGEAMVRRNGVPNPQRQTRLTEVMQAPEEYGFQRFGSLKDVREAIKVDLPDVLRG
jgi:hypothetical protein